MEDLLKQTLEATTDEKLGEIVDKIESSQDQIFESLPDLHEECETRGEANLHLVRAAIRLRERYSQIPFYARKAARSGGRYWIALASSAVNA